MPFGIDDALLIAGGISSIGSLFGDDAPNVDTSELKKYARQFLDFNSQFYRDTAGEVRRNALDNAPTLDTFLSLMRSQGFGSGMATKLAEQSRTKSLDAATRAVLGTRAQFAQLGLGAMESAMGVETQNANRTFQANEVQRERLASLGDNMLALGGGMKYRQNKLTPNPVRSGSTTFMDLLQPEDEKPEAQDSDPLLNGHTVHDWVRIISGDYSRRK